MHKQLRQDRIIGTVDGVVCGSANGAPTAFENLTSWGSDPLAWRMAALWSSRAFGFLRAD